MDISRTLTSCPTRTSIFPELSKPSISVLSIRIFGCHKELSNFFRGFHSNVPSFSNVKSSDE